MAAFLITCEASDGAVTHYRLTAPTWHEAWQALRDRRDDVDSARIRNRSEGDLTDVEILTGRLRIRIQSDRQVATRPTESLGAGPQPHVTRRIEPEARPLTSEWPTASGHELELDEVLVIPTRPIGGAVGPGGTRSFGEREGAPLALRGASASGRDETLPALAAEAFQNLPVWRGQQPAVTPTVRPAPRSRRRPDVTEDLPAVTPTAGSSGLAAPAGPASGLAAPGPATGLAAPPDPGAGLAYETRQPPARPEGYQTLRPLPEPGAGTLALNDLMAWAVDTVARQVPARLALGLEVSAGVITITQARGEDERALREARAELAHWPIALDLGSENRLKLGGEPLVTWWRDRAGVRHALELRAAMWTSFTSADGTRRALFVIDPPRAAGFTEGEWTALQYLTRLVAERDQARGEDGWT